MVKQNVDIWSLSCVFSEVATWVFGGWHQLEEYRLRRVQETERRFRKREDCFHDDYDLLMTVKQSHDDIISRSADDPITPEVVKTLIYDMMLPREADRPSAPFVYRKTRRLIDDVKTRIDRLEGRGLSFTNSDPQISAATKSPPSKHPPNFPPGYPRSGSGGSEIATYSDNRPGLRSNPHPSSAGHTQQAHGGTLLANPRISTTPDSYDQSFEQGTSSKTHQHSLQYASGSDEYYECTGPEASSPTNRDNRYWESGAAHPDLVADRLQRASLYNTSATDRSAMNRFPKRTLSSHRQGSEHRPSQALVIPPVSTDPEDPFLEDSGRSASQWPTSRSTMTASIPQQGPSRSSMGPRLDSSFSENHNIPMLSVEEGLIRLNNGPPFLRDDLLLQLRKRDHVSLLAVLQSCILIHLLGVPRRPFRVHDKAP